MTGSYEGKGASDGRPVLLFDGNCAFCRMHANRLQRWSQGRLRLASFREPGVLDPFPTLDLEACEREVQLAMPGGRIYGGVDALSRAVGVGHPKLGHFLGFLGWPLIRHVARGIYTWVARHRYWFGGHCDGPGCARHPTAPGPRS